MTFKITTPGIKNPDYVDGEYLKIIGSNIVIMDIEDEDEIAITVVPNTSSVIKIEKEKK